MVGTVNAFKDLSSFSSRMLANMPADVANSFTQSQLALVQEAYEADDSRRHPVDIRFSLPLFGERYYLVLLAGRERRSPGRRARDKAKRLLWTFGNTTVFILFLLMLIPAVVGAVRIISS